MIKIDFFHGVQGVASSNLVIPTQRKASAIAGAFLRKAESAAAEPGASEGHA